MQMSGVRLAILQDRIAAEGKAAIPAFERQRRDSIAFHKSIIALIDQQTEPIAHFPAEIRQPLLGGDPFPHSVTVFGKTASGKVKYSPHEVGQGIGSNTVWRLDSIENVSSTITAGARDLLDWSSLRRDLKNESTNLGAAMIQEWEKAPARLSKTVKTSYLKSP